MFVFASLILNTKSSAQMINFILIQMLAVFLMFILRRLPEYLDAIYTCVFFRIRMFQSTDLFQSPNKQFFKNAINIFPANYM